jgi:hypothetical protein
MTNSSSYHSLSLEDELALDGVQQASLRCTTTLLIKLGTLHTDTRLIKVHITILGRILERIPGQDVASPQLRRIAAECLRSMEVAWPTLLLANAKNLTDLAHSEACPSVTTSALMLAMTVLSNGCAAYLRKQKLSTISRGSLLSVSGSVSGRLNGLRKENNNNNNNNNSNSNTESVSPLLGQGQSQGSGLGAAVVDNDVAPLFACSAPNSQIDSASQPNAGKGALATVVEKEEQHPTLVASSPSSSPAFSVVVEEGSGNGRNVNHTVASSDDASPRAMVSSQQHMTAASVQETMTTTSNISDLARTSAASNATATTAAVKQQQQQQHQQFMLMKGGFSDTASHSSSYNSMLMTTGTLPLLHEKPGGLRYFRVPAYASQGSVTVVASPAELQEVQRLTLSFMETLPRLPSAAVHDARQLLLPLLHMSTPKPKKLRSILEKMLATGSPQLVHIVLDISDDLEHLLNEDACVNSDDGNDLEEEEEEKVAAPGDSQQESGACKLKYRTEQQLETNKTGMLLNNSNLTRAAGQGRRGLKSKRMSSTSSSSLLLHAPWHTWLSDRLVQVLNSPLIPVESRTIVLTWLLKQHAQCIHDQSFSSSSKEKGGETGGEVGTADGMSNGKSSASSSTLNEENKDQESSQEEEEEGGKEEGENKRMHHRSPLLSRWIDLLPKTRDTGRIVTLKVKALSACLACGVGDVWEICQAVCTWEGFWSQCPTGEEQRVATFVLRVLATTELPLAETTTSNNSKNNQASFSSSSSSSQQAQQAQQALLHYSLVVSIVHWVASRPQYAPAIEEFISQCSSDLRILLLGALNALFGATSKVLHRAQTNRAAASLLPPSPLRPSKLSPSPHRPRPSISASSSFKREMLGLGAAEEQQQQQGNPQVCSKNSRARVINFNGKNNGSQPGLFAAGGDSSNDNNKASSFSLMGSLKKAASNWSHLFSATTANNNNNNNSSCVAAAAANGGGDRGPADESCSGRSGTNDVSWSRKQHHHHCHESRAKTRLMMMMSIDKSDGRAAADVVAANTPPPLPRYLNDNNTNKQQQQKGTGHVKSNGDVAHSPPGAGVSLTLAGSLPARGGGGGVKRLFPIGVGGALGDDETASQLLWEIGTSASGQVYNNHNHNNRHTTTSGMSLAFASGTTASTDNNSNNIMWLLNSWTRPPPEGLNTLEDVREELFDVPSWNGLVEIMLNAAASIFTGTGGNSNGDDAEDDYLLLAPLMLEILREPAVRPIGTLQLLSKWTDDKTSAAAGCGGDGRSVVNSNVIAQAVALIQAAAIVHVFAKGSGSSSPRSQKRQGQEAVAATAVDCAVVNALETALAAVLHNSCSDKKAKKKAKDLSGLIARQIKAADTINGGGGGGGSKGKEAAAADTVGDADRYNAAAAAAVAMQGASKSVDRTSSLQDVLQEMLNGYIDSAIIAPGSGDKMNKRASGSLPLPQ